MTPFNTMRFKYLIDHVNFISAQRLVHSYQHSSSHPPSPSFKDLGPPLFMKGGGPWYPLKFSKMVIFKLWPPFEYQKAPSSQHQARGPLTTLQRKSVKMPGN